MLCYAYTPTATVAVDNSFFFTTFVYFYNFFNNMLTFYQTLCDRYQAGELPELIAQQVYNPSVLRDMAVYRTYLRLKDEYESRYGLSSCSPRKKGRLMQQLKVAVCELYPSTKRCAPHIEVSTLERIIFRMEIMD